jgi:hypothetical protein
MTELPCQPRTLQVEHIRDQIANSIHDSATEMSAFRGVDVPGAHSSVRAECGVAKS